MDCHIVPVTYISHWSTDDTLACKRPHRKVYVLDKKSPAPILELKKIVNINSPTIVKKDLYVTPEIDKAIECNMNILYEDKWNSYIDEIESFISNNQGDQIITDYLLRFFSLQIYRIEVYIKPAISQILEDFSFITLLAAISNPENDEKYINEKFLKNLLGFLTEKDDNPISETYKKIKHENQIVFIITDETSKHNFITSDLPAYKIDNDCLAQGYYMPITPKICLFLRQRKNNNNESIIKSVNDNVIKFINHLTYSRAENIVISKHKNITEQCNNLYPEQEFIDITNNEVDK